MDPHSMMALAATRGDDLMRDAQEFRRARLARESRADERPARRQKPRPEPARRLGIAG